MGEISIVEPVRSVPDTWRQGRGAWGGLLVRAMVYAVVNNEIGSQEVRSITALSPSRYLQSHIVSSRG